MFKKIVNVYFLTTVSDVWRALAGKCH